MSAHARQATTPLAQPDASVSTERAQVASRTASLLGGLDGASEQARREIRDEVVMLHLGLAAAAARRYGSSTEQDDALQVARMGLVEAFDRFDPSRQVAFSQFAWVTMHGLLLRHLRDHGWSVRPPRRLQETANVLRRTTPLLTQRLGRFPAVAELAEELDWSVAAVRAARTAEQSLTTTSLDNLTEHRSVAEHVDWDLIGSRVSLARTLARLDEDDRELLRLRYIEELTQAEIGRRCGHSQMYVSRLLARLTAKLRHLLEDDEPGDTLPAKR